MTCRLVETLNVSGNLALHPVLSRHWDGELAIAWYEYTSAIGPARSDVWFRQWTDQHGWLPPECISAGVSYNNGPALCPATKPHTWCCAWHSWRPPGKEPFSPGGDICHIWFAERGPDMWKTAQQAFPEQPGSEYATWVAFDDCQWLFALERPSGTLLHTVIRNHKPVEAAQRINTGFRATWISGTRSPSGACLVLGASTGDVAIANIGKENGNLTLWPVDLPHGRHHRPKISACPDGSFLITSHSNHWASYETTLDLMVPADTLDLLFKPVGTAGRKAWVVHYIDIIGEGYRRRYDFGPPASPSHNDNVCTAAHLSYDPDRGYGFIDGPPKTLLRELGDAWTRGLAYDYEAARFRMSLPPGKSRVVVGHGSWIASGPATDIRVLDPCRMTRFTAPESQPDRCYVTRISPDFRKVLGHTPIGPDDCNRPSAMITCDNGLHYIALNSWHREQSGIDLYECRIP